MKKNIFIKILPYIIFFILGLIVRQVFISDSGLGAIFTDKTKETIIGTSTDYISVPSVAVFADATTTSAYGNLNNDPGTIDQLVTTSGIRKIKMSIGAVGGTATSTLYQRMMASWDGTNYFDIATSTDSNATTTMAVAPVLSRQWTPGTASTTITTEYEIDGYPFVRFITWSSDLATDPD